MICVTQKVDSGVKAIFSYDLFVITRKQTYFLSDNKQIEVNEEDKDAHYLRTLAYRLFKDSCLDERVIRLGQSVYGIKDLYQVRQFKWFFENLNSTIRNYLEESLTKARLNKNEKTEMKLSQRLDFLNKSKLQVDFNCFLVKGGEINGKN